MIVTCSMRCTAGLIRQHSQQHGARVYVDVINAGTPKIPQRETRRPSNPLFKGATSEKRGENGGLGLSIAEGYVHKQPSKGNCIWSTGKTVCFRVELPSSKTRNHANSLSPSGTTFASSARTCSNPHCGDAPPFLRADPSMPPTNTPAGMGDKSGGILRRIFQRLFAPTAVAGREPPWHRWHCWVACREVHNKPADTPAEEKFSLSTG